MTNSIPLEYCFGIKPMYKPNSDHTMQLVSYDHGLTWENDVPLRCDDMINTTFTDIEAKLDEEADIYAMIDSNPEIGLAMLDKYLNTINPKLQRYETCTRTYGWIIANSPSINCNTDCQIKWQSGLIQGHISGISNTSYNT